MLVEFIITRCISVSIQEERRKLRHTYCYFLNPVTIYNSPSWVTKHF